MRTKIIGILPLLLLGGCDDSGSSSSSYTSNQIAPRITVVEDQYGDVTTVAVMQSITGTSLSLADGDRLYASLNTSPEELLNANDNLFQTGHDLTSRVQIMEYRGPGKYSAIDQTDDLSPPIRAYVGFERGNGDWAGQTSVVIPGGFTMLNPASYSSISRSVEDPTTVSWTNVDETTTMELDVRMICNNETYFAHVSLGADTGTAQLNAADYFPVDAPDTSCHAVFTLGRMTAERYIAEELGTAGGSSIRGIKQRMVEFTSTP